MKKILILLSGLIVFNSCLSHMENTLSYNLQAYFDYPLNQYGEQFGIVENENPSEKNDSLFVTTALDPQGVLAYGWRDLGFFYKIDEGKNFTGGFIASYSRDYKPYETIGEDTVFPKYWSAFENKYYKKPADNGTKADENKKDEILLAPNGFLLYRADSSEENMPEHDIIFVNTKYGSCTLNGCLINNTAQNVAALKKSLQKGDVVKVTAVGTRDGKETGTKEIVLAEWNDERKFVMQEWSEFDLSPLGDVDYVDFKWDSSRPEIAPYFCIDVFTAAVSLSY